MKRAIIAGAGIAGLATALRLEQDGWRTLIVEQAPARRGSGYLVNLIGPGYDAAERLGLLPVLAPKSLGVFTTVLVRPDGSPKLTVPAAIAEAALGDRVLTVFRGDLEAALFDRVRAEVRFGTTVTAVDQDPSSVRVKLSDGTAEQADLLIGADGVHSRTRSSVFGPDFRVDFPYVVAAFPLSDRGHEGATTYIDVGRTASILELGPDRSAAFFTYRCADPEAELARGPAAALGDAFAGVPFAADLPIPGDVYFDRVSQVVMPRWSAGRVVLTGDAAWCVTLFAGHGAALALAGADRLGAALAGRDDIPAALASWEDGLRPLVIRRQAVARRGMTQYAPPTRFHVRLSEMTMRAVTLPIIRGLVRRAVARQSH
ncbi:FAD-dependent oxidoreductase [Actinoplanes sp. OR16]|uniref:FAD-dependent oxidoreductase n=1 Tax=Actinoplanes sp. OR16 TaxID=946334 RepID=UPI000FD99B2E|nr:FAD-dependent oxidoreductase [Actinoplanes sp. OR16]